jgi:hypothetical protein
VLVVQACAGAFALAAALSLWNGTTEWTAAFRGLAAAVACAVLVPALYTPIERAWNGTAARLDAEAAPGAAAVKPAGSPPR